MTSHATDPRPVRRVSAVTASGAISQEDFDPVVVEAPLSIAHVRGEAGPAGNPNPTAGVAKALRGALFFLWRRSF